ncbi:DNA-binding transcriptional regulator, XRE-family HTH domain [Pedobacter rhizosphaerae]|uniref:DNA-binding transcriptional regulator, XRE-family HTH domain n=2 Tax=Pedobacter rhizosphaerae TaxID=390241 RepID=A0A1H9V4D0_9SPHI|nr:DNA-binding transcriptional regulator, XRE-family HTH domain [Pedobacter rhizosphaerae]
MLDIGITLRKYRDSCGYSQQFVANCLEISRVSYRKWENNEVDFSINQLEKISEFYSIPIDQIIKDSYMVVGYMIKHSSTK